MKAVVLEIKGNKAIALSDDGTFADVRNNRYKIGQTIEMKEKIMKKMTKRYRNIAVGIAASMVILLGGGSAYAYNTPVAHVSMDVNPSVMYSVNALNKVIAVEMSNVDAEDLILDTIDWDGEDLSTVIKNTIAKLQDNGYLEGTEWYENEILIGVNSDSEKREQKLITLIKNELQDIVEEETDNEVDEKALKDVVIGIGAERVAEAEALSSELEFDVTPGKLNLVQKLDASHFELTGEHFTTSEAAVFLKGSVKDIMAQTKANRLSNRGVTPESIDAEVSDDVSDKSGNGNSNGSGNVNAIEKANENANKNINESEMEKEKNANATQNRPTQAGIKTAAEE